MANEPIYDSRFIAGVAPEKNVNGVYVPLRIVVDDNYDPPRLLVHILGTVNQGLTGVYTEAFDYTGDSVTYHGWATPGTAKSAAAWAIVKFTYSGSNVTDIQWAGGSASFNQVWDNRASLGYS